MDTRELSPDVPNRPQEMVLEDSAPLCVMSARSSRLPWQLGRAGNVELEPKERVVSKTVEMP